MKTKCGARWSGWVALISLAAAAISGRIQGAPAGASGAGDVWWKHAVIYEIYPRSFQDSNGDGVGDLNGITERLGYLQWLGVNAIWIAPMYPSPQVDFGYDISDYESVDPRYGPDFGSMPSRNCSKTRSCGTNRRSAEPTPRAISTCSTFIRTTSRRCMTPSAGCAR